MKLYSFFRSSAAYRVRIALALKGLTYEYVPVQIARGLQFEAPYRDISPQALVPILDDDGELLQQSLAIVEYLDETHPEPPLLPASPIKRSRVRSLALLIACEIHPLNNLRVLKYLVNDLKVGDGDEVTDGTVAVVDYIGANYSNGVVFDASYGRAPFPVTVGAGQVIKGWDQGLVG